MTRQSMSVPEKTYLNQQKIGWERINIGRPEGGKIRQTNASLPESEIAPESCWQED